MEDFIKISMLFSMFFVAYFVGLYISKAQRFASLKKRGKRFGSIDGLRGYLAISIFVHHFMLTWYWKNTGHWYRPHELYFQNIGIVGVMLFFMILVLFVSTFTCLYIEKPDIQYGKRKLYWL